MADAKPTLVGGVIVPSLFAALLFAGLGLFLATFLGDTAALALGLTLGVVSFVAGRVLAHLDRPRGRGMFARRTLTGLSLGLAGMALIRAMFLDGPGWPYTPWWALAAGLGFGLCRAHATLLDAARRDDGAARLWGVLHPKDVQALGILAAGYLLLGLAALMLYRALLAPILGGQLLALAATGYALWGARLLLRFAAEERSGHGIVGWLKANLLQNVLVALVLAGYLAFHAQLAATIPYFPLVEFGLGMAVFAFAVARLRSRLRRDATALASASEARPHAQRVEELREAEHDAVAGPVTRFVESGLGAREYAEAIRASARLDDAQAEDALSPLRAHREPPRPPPTPLAWSLGAGAALTLGLAIAAGVLVARVMEGPMPYPLVLALALAGFGAYAQQDVARSHHRPWLALAIAAAGVATLLVAFLVLAAELGDLANVPGAIWGIALGIAGALLAIPAIMSWRLHGRLARGEVHDARRKAPLLELQEEMQRQRKGAATLLTVGALMLLPVPWLADWAAAKGFIPAQFPGFLDGVLAVALWGIAGFAVAALVRVYGLAEGRPRLVARERARRDERLRLHRSVMSALDRM